MSDMKSCCDVDHGTHEEFIEQTDRWDKIGITLSGLCAIHCLITPILLLAIPALGAVFEAAWVHVVMAIFIVPIGIFAFYSGYLHHKKKGLMALGFVGLALIGAGLLLPLSRIDLFGHDVVTIAGSVCLIIAHVLNRRACLCHRH